MADCASGVLQARALEYAQSYSASSHRRGQRVATRGVGRLLTDAGIEVTARSGTANELQLVLGFGAAALVPAGRQPDTDFGRKCRVTSAGTIGPTGFDFSSRVRRHPRSGRRPDPNLGVFARP